MHEVHSRWLSRDRDPNRAYWSFYVGFVPLFYQFSVNAKKNMKVYMSVMIIVVLIIILNAELACRCMLIFEMKC